MARFLHIGELEIGQWGVLEASVQTVGAKRTFNRKRGGEGSLQRVTLSDGTGEVDLVLWDDEIATHADVLRPGNRITLKGPTVKAGYQGGTELHLGAGELHAAATATAIRIEGTITRLEPTQVVDTPGGPAFKAECTIAAGGTEHHVVCWGDAVQAVQGGAGAKVALDVVQNPALEGWFTAGSPAA